MKSIIQFSVLTIIMVMAITISSCGNYSDVKKDGIEYTSKYICPMHCAGSGSDEAGICPKCGMDYVENMDIKSGNNSDKHGEHHH